MTNPTSNFNWQMPTPTDLVTDLPADFEVFGQAVDTSMADLLGGTTGQILAKASNSNMDFAWITNDVGDITAVNVTSPITGGGSSGAVTIGINAATTSVVGAVQLSDSTSTTSSVLASTPTATKAAYDLADAAIAKSVVTTAGDIIYRNATVPVRLGIGTAGQVLTVNGGANAPEWATAPVGSAQVAGKNAVINGDFFINQRGFTSNTTTGTYNFDRWLQQNVGGSFTVTPQSFTPGAAPIATYEGRTYFQGITATQSAAGDYAILTQRIENVTRYAGTTVTISFFAKANTGTPAIGVEIQQNFGTGGSPSATVSTPAGAITLSSSWARYSVSVAVPSISGKTIGTGENSSYLELNLWTSSGATNATRASSIGIQNFTASIWGVQLEYSASATYFTTATGTLQGELAACQRYYQIIAAGSTTGKNSTTEAAFNPTFPSMRIKAITFTVTGALVITDEGVANFTQSAAAVNLSTNNGNNGARLNLPNFSGLTTYRGLTLASAHQILANAEL
jgi:hypothetical protein